MNNITREAFFRKWLIRLRSGMYPQTKGKLSDQDGYCCLGVACELGLELGIVNVKEGFDYDGATFVLPRSLQTFLNITSQGAFNPNLSETGLRTLSELNDEAGMDFDQLADFIEKVLDTNSFEVAEVFDE